MKQDIQKEQQNPREGTQQQKVEKWKEDKGIYLHETQQQQQQQQQQQEQLELNIRGKRQAEKVKDLRKAFALFDRDGTGTIDREELEQCLNSVGIHPTPAEMDALYSSMDTDGDGKIDFAEFMDAMVGEFEEQELEEELKDVRDMFALVDTDGSGRLSPEELKNAIRAMGVHVDDDVCLHLFREMARENPDLGVTFDEFAVFLLKD